MNEAEERKRIRRERIRRRLENNSQQETVKISTISEGDVKCITEKSKAEIQIFDSLAFLEKKKREALETVTSFRIDTIANENERRIQEEKLQKQRHHKCIQCNEGIDDQNKNLNSLWESLLKLDKPLDLVRDLEIIKESYGNVSNGIDSTIDMLKQHLIQKDEEYIRILRRQTDVTTKLQSAMDSAIIDMQTYYQNEILSIQDALVDDRTRLIQSQMKELKELVDSKAKHLENSLNELGKRRQDRLNVIKSNQGETSQSYVEIKMNLHAHVNKLESDLAKSRATFHINSDQLEYNVRATTTKNAENEEKIKKCKKRIVLYKEELSKELDHSKSLNLSEKRKNDVLTQDCIRLEGQYNNLLSKLHRFEMVEGQKYAAAAAMHQDEIALLSNRILNAKKEVETNFTKSLDSLTEQDEDVFDICKGFAQSEMAISKDNGTEKTSSSLWNQVESMFSQYNTLLEDRETLLNNISVLNELNTKLEQELDTLLNDEDVNGNLIVPPLKA